MTRIFFRQSKWMSTPICLMISLQNKPVYMKIVKRGLKHCPMVRLNLKHLHVTFHIALYLLDSFQTCLFFQAKSKKQHMYWLCILQCQHRACLWIVQACILVLRKHMCSTASGNHASSYALGFENKPLEKANGDTLNSNALRYLALFKIFQAATRWFKPIVEVKYSNWSSVIPQKTHQTLRWGPSDAPTESEQSETAKWSQLYDERFSRTEPFSRTLFTTVTSLHSF